MKFLWPNIRPEQTQAGKIPGLLRLRRRFGDTLPPRPALQVMQRPPVMQKRRQSLHEQALQDCRSMPQYLSALREEEAA